MTETGLKTSCCTTPAVLCFSAAVFLILYGAGLMLLEAWPSARNYSDVLLLGAIGLTCVVNFLWNRTYHCGITGPLFLVAAGVLALTTAGIWSVSTSLVWSLVLIGTGLAFLLEWRYAT